MSAMLSFPQTLPSGEGALNAEWHDEIWRDAVWAAHMARDTHFDGSLVFAVTTTGIYCKPSCAAKPKRENVKFFADNTAAEAAGFRPCKRCKPENKPIHKIIAMH